MKEAVEMHAIIHCNHGSFICLSSPLQSQLGVAGVATPRMTARPKEGEDKTRFSPEPSRWLAAFCEHVEGLAKAQSETQSRTTAEAAALGRDTEGGRLRG